MNGIVLFANAASTSSFAASLVIVKNKIGENHHEQYNEI
jgi:hypothetical protein